MLGTLVAIWLVCAIVGGVVGFAIGNSKERGAAGFWLGFLFGFFGWIIVAVMEPSAKVRAWRQSQLATAIASAASTTPPPNSLPDDVRSCPFCAETIKRAAVMCRHCGRDLPAGASPFSARVLTLAERKSEFSLLQNEYPDVFEITWALAISDQVSFIPQELTPSLRHACQSHRAGDSVRQALVAAGFRFGAGGQPPSPPTQPTIPQLISTPPTSNTVVGSVVENGIRSCPFCAEMIKQAAVLCRYCGRDVPAWTPPRPLTLAERKEEFSSLQQEYPTEFETVWNSATSDRFQSAPARTSPALKYACDAVRGGLAVDQALLAAGFKLSATGKPAELLLPIEIHRWLPDPHNGDYQRLWNGTKWTGHVRGSFGHRLEPDDHLTTTPPPVELVRVYPNGQRLLSVNDLGELSAWDGTNEWVANWAPENSVTRTNLSTGTKTSYDVGKQPAGVEFDGTHIWVTNYGSDTITRLHPETLERTDYPAGKKPFGIAHDGAHLWVANEGDQTLSRIDPATGIGIVYPTPHAPQRLTWDGADLIITVATPIYHKWRFDPTYTPPAHLSSFAPVSADTSSTTRAKATHPVGGQRVATARTARKPSRTTLAALVGVAAVAGGIALAMSRGSDQTHPTSQKGSPALKAGVHQLPVPPGLCRTTVGGQDYDVRLSDLFYDPSGITRNGPGGSPSPDCHFIATTENNDASFRRSKCTYRDPNGDQISVIKGTVFGDSLGHVYKANTSCGFDPQQP